MVDALDDLFETPDLEFLPKVKLLPKSLLYFCAMGDHKRCGLYGWVNSTEGKSGSNAGNRIHARCSCACHRDEFDT